MELIQASAQWASRPSDERFTSLIDLHKHTSGQRQRSNGKVLSSKSLTFEPMPTRERTHLMIVGPNGAAAEPTNFSFGQVASLAGVPAGYMRTLGEKGLAPLAADCMNAGLKVIRDVEDVGVLLTREDDLDGPSVRLEMRAATGPKYGRIWNAEITASLVRRFGDGVTGEWKVPGEFGKDVPITKENTTLWSGDRDMFVFLADEKNRIEIADRRPGLNGSSSLARGFFLWNSEVGASTMGAAFFLFDYACKNRIVWGAREFKEIRIRHTVSAPDRWLAEITPVLVEYANSKAGPIEAMLAGAQQKRLDDVDDFLKSRHFTARETTLVKAAHVREEGRPIETLWDAVTGVTAHAKTISWQDERVSWERRGGDILDLVAN